MQGGRNSAYRGFVALPHMALCSLLLTVLCMLGSASAQTAPFDRGWQLDAAASALRFQSVKNVTKVESSSFATLAGSIDPGGNAVVRVALDSVDTTIDLRNVRMRFLFFETFQFPEAVISATINPAALADLAQTRRKSLDLPFTLDLHGVQKQMEANVFVTLLSDDRVAVSSSAPIVVPAADYNLTEGIGKLQDAAGVVIIPSATVSFDFIFNRDADGAKPAQPEIGAKPAATALETAGNFDLEGCKGRFEILSRSGNIFFRSASARLDDKSFAILDSIVDIVQRCPGLMIEVGGHTDDIGSDAANQKLSEARAQSVARYLTEKGIEAQRFHAVGYGESQPVSDNATEEGRGRNRRIGFSVMNNG
ncbi:OmpA family protein [Pseudorhodobacter sp.]|uniref:OmpA family protein n=1 Tax=Pseudorhodobacter sp. TaxID=1934400 RepID=UPI002647DC5F|nr:OmpA family protein [Pseudorhodobacter sp.]MDN5786417.1 OmpA family protein [Pseudorhodobacter sp.]